MREVVGRAVAVDGLADGPRTARALIGARVAQILRHGDRVDRRAERMQANERGEQVAVPLEVEVLRPEAVEPVHTRRIDEGARDHLTLGLERMR